MSTEKDYPGLEGFTEGDMALELAEYEFMNLSPYELMHYGRGPNGANDSMREIMDRAEQRLIKEWLEATPEYIREIYTRLIGEID